MKEFPANGWRITQTISALAFFFCVPARAHVYVVTDTNDTTSVTSLRGAIIDANARGGENTIILGEETDPRRREPPQPWTFYLTIQGADEDAAQTGDLDITDGKLTIIGATPNVTIDAAGLGDRVFQVFSNAQLTLAGLVVTGGTTPYNIYLELNEPGGAILNFGTLVMQDCLIAGNSLVGDGRSTFNGGSGGGIFNIGVARLGNCVISGNSAGAGATFYGGYAANGGDGGGIYNMGKMILNECTISANLSGPGAMGGSPSEFTDFDTSGGSAGAGGNGAGVYNAGQMTMNFSTIKGNSCGNGGNGVGFGEAGDGGTGGNGAGIFNIGALNINTSTISGNQCGSGGDGGDGFPLSGGAAGNGGDGGGIFNMGSIISTCCTVVSNSTGVGGSAGNGQPMSITLYPMISGGEGGSGGGIFNATNNMGVELRNSLVALNSANVGGLPGTNVVMGPPFDPITVTTQIGNLGTNGVGPDLYGNFTSDGFNLIGAADGSTGFANGVLADQVGTTNAPIDPFIGPLQMNGGPTATHALLRGSPAINKGNCFGVHQDQRGEFRPFDYPGISFAPGGDGSDIGAFELHLNERFEPPRDIFERR